MPFVMHTINYTGTEDPCQDPQSRASSALFCFGLSSMRRMLAIMALAGVIADVEHAALPPALGASHYDDHGEPLTEEGRAYRAAAEAVRREARDDGLVAIYKFETNDEWVVSPDECRALARGLRRLLLSTDACELAAVLADENASDAEEFGTDVRDIPAAEVESWIANTQAFAAFCERSAEHGEGFVVA